MSRLRTGGSGLQLKPWTEGWEWAAQTPSPTQLTTHWPAAPAGLSTARQLGAVGELQAQLAAGSLQSCAAVHVGTVVSSLIVSCLGSPTILISPPVSDRLPEPVSRAELMKSSLFCWGQAGWQGAGAS